MHELVRQTYGGKIRLRVCALCIRDNSLLVVKHKGAGKDYLIAPPGGGVDVFEKAETALARELSEETGLKLISSEFIFACQIVKPPLHAVELFFKTTYEGEIQKGFDPEMHEQIIENVYFTSFDDLRNEIPENKHGIFSEFTDIDEMMQFRGMLYFGTD